MTVAPGLIGRAAETARLAAAWQDAVAGRASSIVVTGPAGCGKTALLSSLRELTTPDTIVLAASGHPAETDLPYAGLHQLLRPLGSQIDPALRGALELAPALGTGQLGVAAALLETLAALSTSTPVMVLLDDLAWLDASSRQALIFVAHRIDAERMLIAGTAADRSDWPDQDVPVTPLDAESARALLGSRHPMLHAVVSRQIVTAAEGLPLALIEIAEGLTPDQRLGRAPSPDLLPLGPTLDPQ